MVPPIAAVAAARRRRETASSDRPLSPEGYLSAKRINDANDAALIGMITKATCWTVAIVAAAIWWIW